MLRLGEVAVPAATLIPLVLAVLCGLAAWRAYRAKRRWLVVFAAAGVPFFLAATMGGMPVALTNAQLGLLPSYQWSSVLRLGVNAVGDAPAQWFSPSSTPCTITGSPNLPAGVSGDIGTQTASADGGCFVAAPIGGPRDIREWSAKDDGNTVANDPAGSFDSTGALQAACAAADNLYFPPGRWHITNQIACHNAQTLQGAGTIRTYVDVGSDFNMSAACTLSLGGAVNSDNQGGSVVQDMKFLYYQPATATTRSQLIHYPPAMCPSNNGRMRVFRVQFSRCWDGIWSVGNFVWLLDRDQFGCFDSNIHADGALDYEFWDHLEFWPFAVGSQPNLNAIWGDGTTQAAYIGRNDGLEIGQMAVFLSNILITNANITGTGIRISKLHLDSPAQVVIQGGAVTIGEYVGDTFVNSSSGLWLPSLIVDDGNASSNKAEVLIGSLHFSTIGSTTPPSATFQLHSGKLTIVGGVYSEYVDATGFLDDAATGPAYLRIANLTVIPVGGSAPLAHPMFLQQQANASFNPAMDLSNIYFTAAGVGQGGSLISYMQDNGFNALSNIKGTNWPAPINLGFNTALGYYDICGQSFPLTASLAFSTNGDFAPTITSSYGSYHRCGDFVDFDLDVTFNTGTYTSASGNFQVIPTMPPGLAAANPTGLPVQIAQLNKFVWSTGQVLGGVINGAGKLVMGTTVSGGLASSFTTANLPSGTSNANFILSGRYRVR